MSLKTFLARAGDASGIALVEFALSLPLMIMIYLGGYQLADAISAYRKVTTTTRAIADVTSQYTTVNDTDLDTILAASQQILAPYSTANGQFTITQVSIDAKGNATVDWSRGKNTSALIKGSAFNVPAGIKQANTSLLIAETQYTYHPNAVGSMVGDIPMRDRIILMPRATGSIIWKAS